MTDSCIPINPDKMREILSLPDEQAETALFYRLAYIDNIHKLSYAEVGNICLQVQAYMLHEQRIDPETGLPCTFSRWVHLAAPYSYSTCYAAMRDCEAMKDVPEEHLAEIPAGNFPVMRQLSTKVRADPGVLKAAKTKKTEAFVEHIRAEHPDEHIESRKTFRFHPEESAAAKIEEALNRAEKMGAHSRDEALEIVALAAMDWWEFKTQELEIDRAMQSLPTEAIQ